HQILERRPQLAEAKHVPAGLELSRLNALACKQHFLRRLLAESQPQDKRGHWKECRASKHRRQHFCELQVPHCIRRYQIHRPRERSRAGRVLDTANDVVHMNPAEPLLPRPDAPAQPQFEWSQHLFQCPAFGAQHHSNADVHRANTRARRKLRTEILAPPDCLRSELHRPDSRRIQSPRRRPAPPAEPRTEPELSPDSGSPARDFRGWPSFSLPSSVRPRFRRLSEPPHRTPTPKPATPEPADPT